MSDNERRYDGSESKPPSGASGRAEVGGVRIAYRTFGDGPALVCCHAFGSDQSLWDPHRPAFSSSHRLITFDQRGSGVSDHPRPEPGRPDPYTIDTFADDLAGVLDALKIEKARILGYSMGAATALRFATRSPERVERLVLVSAMASRLPTPIIARARVVEKLVVERGLEEAYRFYFGGPLFDGLADDARSRITAWAAKATPHGFLGCYRVTIDRPSMIDDLCRIHAPTLIMVGEHDTHYLAEADRMAAALPNARKLVVHNAGHAMNGQVPETFEREVLHFLS